MIIIFLLDFQAQAQRTWTVGEAVSDTLWKNYLEKLNNLIFVFKIEVQKIWISLIITASVF